MDDELSGILEHIERIKKLGLLVIVEGIKDRRALEHFGIRKIMILSKKPLYKVVEDATEKTKKAALLTDLDAEGKKLFGKLNSGLIHHGVKVDKKFREFLFKETKLRQIEGLRKYVGKLAKL